MDYQIRPLYFREGPSRDHTREQQRNQRLSKQFNTSLNYRIHSHCPRRWHCRQGLTQKPRYRSNMYGRKELLVLCLSVVCAYGQILRSLHLRVVTDALTLEKWATSFNWKSDKVASRTICMALCRRRSYGCTHFSHSGTSCMLGHTDVQNGAAVAPEELSDIYIHTRK